MFFFQSRSLQTNRLKVCAQFAFHHSSVCFLFSGSPVERGDREEEAGRPDRDLHKPRELLRCVMDGKMLLLPLGLQFCLSFSHMIVLFWILFVAQLVYAKMCHSFVPISSSSSSVWRLISQEGLCSLWFQTSCFRFSSIGQVQADALSQEGCSRLTVTAIGAMHPL